MWRKEVAAAEEQYLNGYCHFWALDHFQPGDHIVCLIDSEGGELDLMDAILVHCFLKRDNFYVDVRGSTEQIKDILEGFEYGDTDQYSFSDIDEFKSLMHEMRIVMP